MRGVSKAASCAAALVGVLLFTSNAHAQLARYLGRAASAVLLDQTAAEVGAGGTDSEGRLVEEITCDVSVVECFDEQAAGGAIPGLLIAGTARTFGGAQDAEGAARVGFPRVESRASGAVLSIPGLLDVAASPAFAIADSESGELTGSSGPVVVTLGLNQFVVPVGESITIPGLATIFAQRETRTVGDGLAVLRVEGAVIEFDPDGLLGVLGRISLGSATAGLELAFTEGGGGGGGCALAAGDSSSGGSTLVLLLAMLAFVARRRATRS